VFPFLRRLLRRSVRTMLRIARRGPLRRPLAHLRFGPWAAWLFGGEEVIAWRGVRLAVDPGEAHGFHVYFLGDYAGAEIDACTELCRNARWFGDIGANIGFVTLPVARACPSLRAAVVARLHKNIALNPDLESRVQVLVAAATDADGAVTFGPSHTPLNAGIGRLVPSDAAGAITVRGVAIGPYAEGRGQPLDVVKIDVEGAELEVLHGIWAARTRPRALVIETHGGADGRPVEALNRDVLDELAREGYVTSHRDRGGWTPNPAPAALGARAHIRATRP
jgi:FkbM family methyltransferase